ncbi:antibiotic biosynthesis monooxygenase [Acinetobacter sp. ANC 4169]|uniref:antibiotic biosynthesis monooxygenase family protein n=1 Tax=Acinetobacter sp. ANC 4169 TaxID=1977879 RepID=UPI000A35B68A|nr:antibiotic biosynthesis monooxygenase [Acinetobacter sp. ANC 4169]OTG76060.1 antibiotic biosynthesis monooxygenase [Acinetobacter sp. ANC 4169]
MHLDDESSYYAVIFTSVRTDGDHGYSLMASKMLELAKIQQGFLGVESAREEIGITVSYWKSLEAIKKWKEHIDHTLARNLGREEWYSSYTVRISKVIREYSFHTQAEDNPDKS